MFPLPAAWILFLLPGWLCFGEGRHCIHQVPLRESMSVGGSTFHRFLLRCTRRSLMCCALTDVVCGAGCARDRDDQRSAQSSQRDPSSFLNRAALSLSRHAFGCHAPPSCSRNPPIPCMGKMSFVTLERAHFPACMNQLNLADHTDEDYCSSEKVGLSH